MVEGPFVEATHTNNAAGKRVEVGRLVQTVAITATRGGRRGLKSSGATVLSATL